MKIPRLSHRSCLKALFGALFCLTAQQVEAQTKYEFQCRDYISTDDNRAPQNAFKYDDEENSFTISASGRNNIAFQMDRRKDGKYYIRNTQEWFLVEGTDLSTAADANYIWWFNGFNDGGQTAPTHTVQNSEGNTVIAWNIKTTSALSHNLNYENPFLLLSSCGKSFIHAMGLTSKNGSSTISNIGYYASYEAAATYPALMTLLGYDNVSLTLDIKKHLNDAIAQAVSAIEKSGESDAKTHMEQEIRFARQEYEETGNGAYIKVYNALKRLNNELENYKSNVIEYSWEPTEKGMHATLNEMHTHILFYTTDIVRIYKSFDKEIDKESLSVVADTRESVPFSVKENTDDHTVTLSTERMSIIYHQTTGQVEMRRADGSLLIKEKENSTSFFPCKDGPNDSYQISHSFMLDENEHIYGMGQIQDGKLDRRGVTYSMQQDNRFVCIPYFQSSKNYALFWDNYSPTIFTDNEEGTRFQSTGVGIDYYILSGERSEDVLANMRWLTGQSPMPALWNFGLYQSKERYASANETMEVVRKYRELGVPLDCIVQDWQYWGDNAHWNALEFLNPSFANYEEMIRSVHENHTKLMISIWANFGPQTKPYASMSNIGRLLPAESYPTNCGVRPYDVYGKTSRGIYWDYLYKGLVTKNIDAYWMDSSEPDYFNQKASDLDYVTETGQTWRALRNAFPLAHVGGVYTHHRDVARKGDSYLKDKRVSILTRSAFAGQQRYGSNTWSGDVTASWENFAAQIPAACNLSVCGIPYWNSDIGGFFLGRFGGINDPAWRRLYMRWVQFGTFCPMMRFHGTQTPREIYQFGSLGDGVGDYDQILKYIKIRYRLLPYLYSTAWQVSAHQATFMKALPIAFTDDRDGYGVTDEYMFGDAFLVAPVVQDAVNGRDVYLPAGYKWTDFWTGEQIEGGASIKKEAHTDILPLYVKAGSILPWGPDVQYSNEKSWDSLEVRVYPGADGKFVLYEDENDNYNYEQGKHTEIPFTWDDTTKTLTIGERKGEFDGMLKQRVFRICKVSTRRGIGDEHETSYEATVVYDGSPISVELSSDDRKIGLTNVSHYIQNPSFEEDGAVLNKIAPKGWNVKCGTAWWGVNEGYGNGDPVATDGHYIFGVWDASNSAQAEISQVLSNLPVGHYRLSVDMHAPHKNQLFRVGKQCLFANNYKAYFKDQVTSFGSSDNYPLQTIFLDFEVTDEDNQVTIGVTTSDAQDETWFKIDNFQLYMIDRPTLILDENIAYTPVDDGMTDIVLNKSMASDRLTTFCVPFNLSEHATNTYFSDVEELVSVIRNGNVVLELKKCQAIKAGVPYVVKPHENYSELNFKDAVISGSTPSVHTVGGIQFRGIYGPTCLTSNMYYLDDDVFVLADKPENLNGYKAYLFNEDVIPTDRIFIQLADKETSISQIANPLRSSGIYTLSGVQMTEGTTWEELPKGVYMIDGKKIIKR